MAGGEIGRRGMLVLPWLLPAAAQAATQSAGQALSVGETATLRLEAGERRELLLPLEEGDYVAGLLTRGTDPLAEGPGLDLLAPGSDAPLRRLAIPGGGPLTFQFVAPARGEFRLRLLAGAAAELGLGITRILPRAAQLAPDPALAPLDSPRLQALRQALRDGADAPAEMARFWAEIARQGAPLIEKRPDGALVSFLWRGATTKNVRLFGGPSRDLPPLARMPGTDLWFLTVAVPPGTRLTYQLAPDVPELPDDAETRQRAVFATAQADPLNPRPWWPADPRRDRYTSSSVLELEDAPASPWLARRPGVAEGQVWRRRFASPTLGNTRLLALYSPAVTPTAPLPLLVIFDGDGYLDVVPTPTILDNLIAAGAIPPVAALFVGNGPGDARDRELPCNPRFAAALVEEMLPWARAQIRLTEDPAQIVVGGASYGGIAAAFAAFRHPEVFGNVLSQSGSYGWSPEGAAPEWLVEQYASSARLPVRFYLEAGSFERGRPGRVSLFDSNRHMAMVLRARGYTVTHREWSTGHDYIAWRSSLAEGLQALFRP
ncbi:alpha/beta hydrolase-fold protein [Roseomonas sp. 18066]|uniref:alpha/beta hydrolase-fold protein n=1 Tax=Roseomonas sp. 18066 TaxID=2681412 RepID=UPI00135B6FBF|nr:alpha/beta hydrolase-fold protein [Roseomonas sp. 18066]